MSRPVVMWFRQDLRLADNPAFLAAVSAGHVVCVYILDDITPGKWAWGGASRWWLNKSLRSLNDQLTRLGLTLILRRGAADKVMDRLLSECSATALYFTRGYGPWEPELERRVGTVAEEHRAECHRYGGFLLHGPETIATQEGNQFKVFTPFSRACFAKGEPRAPRPAPSSVSSWKGNLASDRLADWNLQPNNPNWAADFDIWTPGEAGARLRLERFVQDNLQDYANGRDRPDKDATSGLSPHLHWGEISPCQCWNAVTSRAASLSGRVDTAANKFLLELLWREFSYHLLYHWPDFPERSFQQRFDAISWREDAHGLKAWQEGKTGVPIVDAGMRQLWKIGYMHNRVRMIAASFLIKDLLIDWRTGERWFWDTLVDADIANNAASWQWVAGSGADAAPYFRIFNPSLQGEKFDPDGEYVRRWIPELAAVPNKWIHRPWQMPQRALEKAGVTLGRDYPHAIVDHAFARNRALEVFGRVREAAAT